VAAPSVTGISPSAGPVTGGTTVTITGTNLSGATAVTFGAGHPAAAITCTATSCTATAPAEPAGTVDVQVTTTGGTSATSANDKYTYKGIAIDQTIAQQGTGTVTTTAFSTSGPRLLVAFTSSDGPGANQTTTVTGAGLTWTLAQRANSKGGTAEIWTAYATGPLTNATITSTPKTPHRAQLLTVEVFTGASGVGATAGASKTSGAPTVTVTTTKANSWVFGVGENPTHATAPTPGLNQTVLQQDLDTADAETFWVQDQNTATPNTGTNVAINDTAPTGDAWNLAAVEILAAAG
jgi:hypothetical protein